MFRTLFVNLIISLTSLFLFTLSNVHAGDVNLAPNPSFEIGDVKPLGWETKNGLPCQNTQVAPPLSFEWSNSISKTGIHSLGLIDINWQTATRQIPGVWVSSDFITILPFPQEYEISTLYFKPSGTNVDPIIYLCEYDINGSLIASPGLGRAFLGQGGQWFSHTFKLSSRDSRVAKIKVGLGTECFSSISCQGSIWFDDVIVRPLGKIKVHKFEDLNRNTVQDQNEANLATWRFQIFRNFNCEGNWFTESPTDSNGDTTFSGGGIPLGDYSILETFIYIERDPVTGRPVRIDGRQAGWVNTTPICQNVTLRELETPIVYFGNVKGPTVPYFSQKDPVWGQVEYDHAGTFGPFFCGTTMAGCGCAVTSSAMVLKFHGVDKSPNGDATNPQTLNNWLKANNGYSFGALKWPSVATYAFKANQNFGTQKIKFSGIGSGNNFTQLDSDLANQSPPILQEPGHFIAATGIQGSTYTINDPAFQNKTTLAAYNNQFQSMRRFEKTNTDLSALYLTTPSPNDLFLVDSQGRRVGRDPETGAVYTEIPNSYYFLEPAFPDQFQEDPTQPSESEGVNTLLILTPGLDTFTINSQGGPVDFSAYDQNGDIKTETFNSSPHSFEINYSPEPGASFEVFQNISIDIRPGDDQNHINLNSKFIPVSLNESSDFDPQSADLNSILFGPSKIEPFRGNSQLLLFETTGSGISENDTEACLWGMTIYGENFKGCDFITIVPP